MPFRVLFFSIIVYVLVVIKLVATSVTSWNIYWNKNLLNFRGTPVLILICIYLL
jgi:hypothetical protein